MIFGHSSGIGAAIYEICKKNNAIVRGYSLPEIDVADFSAVNKAIGQFVKEFGKIDRCLRYPL